MRKFFLIACLLSNDYLFAQPASHAKLASDTTTIKKDDAPLSNVLVNVNLSNSAFSQNSKTLSAAAEEEKLFFIPSVAYNHKSGLAVTANAYLDFQAGTRNPFQMSVSPSYSYTKNKDFEMGGGYTFYFDRDTTSKYSSPYQHEITAFYTNKKSWLRWGFSVDFATGKSTYDYSKDSVITVLGVKKNIRLSATGKSSTTDFIASANISHEFDWEKVFAKGGNFSFVPTFMLNTGTDDYSVAYTGNVNSFALAQLSKRKAGKTVGGNQRTPFKLQSAALSTTFTYEIGNFSITPDFYLEYYLPKADSRFLYIYTIGFAYTFY